MRTTSLLLIMVGVLALGLILTVPLMSTKVNDNVDIVMINRMLKTVEEHWRQPEQGDYSGIQQRFTVLDQNGQVRYQSPATDPSKLANFPAITTDERSEESGMAAHLYEAIKKRDAVLDITIDNEVVGKLIVHNDTGMEVERSKKQLLLTLLLTFMVMVILGALYLLYLKRTIITPFNKLQNFARQIARGNLDVPLHMDKNNLFGAFTESFDIMREELAAARQSEYEANRSKKELVASLSHDVKTPVASIKAVTELMLLRATDEKVIKQLTMISAKAEQINLLVTDLFHATLEELQELKVTVTEEYSSILHGMIENVNFDDQIQCEPIPACIILTDAVRLQQVFDNVISNSYKYAGTSVRIVSQIVPGYLQVDIMDHGPGVQAEELPLLFHKFYRGDNVVGRQGAGLGLYISRYLMQSMHGEIECHNRSDGFTVTLRIKLI